MLSRLAALSILIIFSVLPIRSQSAVSTQTDKQKIPIVVPSAAITDEIGLIEGRVVIVYDGDNVSVQGKDGKIYSIRMHGIDAPEPGQSFGKKSRKKLEDLILDKEVKVIVHKKDTSDRYLGTIYLNGQDIGLRQLENGYAWHYKRFSGEQAADVRDRYARAELKAREEKNGLWSETAPIPPWEFRDEKFTETLVDSASESSASPELSAKSSVTGAVPPGADPSSANPATDRKYVLGPRGGCYYLNSSGSKVYVKDKSLCTKP